MLPRVNLLRELRLPLIDLLRAHPKVFIYPGDRIIPIYNMADRVPLAFVAELILL